MKRLCAVLLILFLLAGCGGEVNGGKSTLLPSSTVDPAGTDATMIPVEKEKENEEEPATAYQKEGMGAVPQLPASGASIHSFIPESWRLLDSVEFDYNGDKLPDVVGILDHIEEESDVQYPRILFAIQKTAAGGYSLDFQNENLIYNANEGGPFGDPYESLTAKDNTFTIQEFGGSSSRWGEAKTFAYRNGGWYLTQRNSSGHSGPVTLDNTVLDYITGIGVSQVNSEDEATIAFLSELEEERFELEYTVKLDAMPTLYEASQRYLLAKDRLRKLSVRKIQVSKEISLPPSQVPHPISINSVSIEYMDELYIAYVFAIQDTTYLAIYNRESLVIDVIAQTTAERQGRSLFSGMKIYKDRIYFCQEIYGPVQVKENGEIIEEQSCVSIQVVRMNLDGTGTEVLYRYKDLYTEGEVLEKSLPYILATCDISGGELILSLRIGSASKYYRIAIDSLNVQYIGEVKGLQ